MDAGALDALELGADLGQLVEEERGGVMNRDGGGEGGLRGLDVVVDGADRLEHTPDDRDGGEEPVAADRANYQEFNLSPDGERVAVGIAGDDPAVWIYDLTRDITTRLTFES